MTLAYAAGIGDVGPKTFDDAAEAGMMAPPSFCSVLEWPVLSQGRARLSGLSEAERRRAVHVEQDSVFHRPIRPGDRLSTGARIVAGRATRAGAFVKTRAVTVDARNGTPVVTSWHGSIYRGVAWSGSGREFETGPPYPAAGRGLDRRHAIATRIESAHVYTECSGIWNPIHTERRAALAAGLPGIILHGTALWALAGRELIRSYGGNEPANLRRLRVRFAAMLEPGETLTLSSGAAVDSSNVHFAASAGDDRMVLADGFAEFASGVRRGAGAS
jgi:acyl dehydratase